MIENRRIVDEVAVSDLWMCVMVFSIIFAMGVIAVATRLGSIEEAIRATTQPTLFTEIENEK